MTSNQIRWSHALLSVVGVAGCSGDVTNEPDAHPCRGPVDGVRETNYLLAGVTTPRSADSSHLALASVVPDNGQWTTTPAQLAADSRFVFPGACDGYLVKLNAHSFFTGNTVPTFIATTAEAVDLTSNQLGRADVVLPGSGTTLVLDLSGLDAWDANDDLQLTAAGAGLGFSSLPSVMMTAPAAGDHSVSSAVDYTSIATATNAGLIDSTRGDQAYVTQLSSLPVTGDLVFAQTLTRAATLSALTMANQQSTHVVGELVAATPQTFTSMLLRDGFATVATDVNPAAGFVESDLHIDVLPTGSNQSYTGGFADLAWVAVSAAAGSFPLDIAYANPFPASWPVIANVYGYYQVSLSVPAASGGAAVTYTQYPTISSWDLLDAFGSAGVGPRVGPVHHPRIDGHDLFAGQSAIAETPTLSWEKPSLGDPDYYNIIIQELASDGTTVSATELAELATTATSIVVPPGIIGTGKHVTFMITAVVSAGLDLQHAPFLGHMVPFATADVVSGLMTR